MPRLALAAALSTLVLSPPARAEGEKAEDLVRALQRKVTKAAREVGPAVASIYVSRSDSYARAPHWGSTTPQEYSGQLGRFDAEAARKKVPEKVRNRARILRAIAEHDLSDPEVVPESYGSGLVIDRAGLVLTCAHVVKNATRVYVRLPGKAGSWADIHASDPRSDLAVLKLLDVPRDLAAHDLGKGGTVKKGEFVLCLSNGYAPGFRRAAEPSVDYGLVSNLRSRTPAHKETDLNKLPLSHYGILIETDARVTPGCSGGTLLDLDGRVVGLTTALAGLRGDQPGGFAIPIDPNTIRIIDALRKGEEVEYGFLGVVIDQFAPGGVVRLAQVSPGSPASRAGLMVRDEILSINGNNVRDRNDLFLYLGMNLAGNPAKLEVMRGQRRRTVNVTLAKYYVPGPVIAAKRPPARFGLRVDYLSVLAQRNLFWNWSRMPSEGVIVREVVPGGPADKALLQPDKVITHVNGKRVQTPGEYYAAVEKSGEKVELTYLNSEGRPAELTLKGK